MQRVASHMSGMNHRPSSGAFDAARESWEEQDRAGRAVNGDVARYPQAASGEWTASPSSGSRDPFDARSLKFWNQKKRRLSEEEGDTWLHLRGLRCERLDLSDLPPLLPANDVMTPAAALTPSGAVSAAISEAELRMVQTIAEFGQNTNTPRFLAAIQEHHQKDFLGVSGAAPLAAISAPPVQKSTEPLLAAAAPEDVAATLDALSSPALSRDSVRYVPDQDSSKLPQHLGIEPSMPGMALEECRRYARQVSGQYVDELRRKMRGACGQCGAALGSCNHATLGREVSQGEWSSLTPSRRRIAKNRETAAVSRFRKKVYLESLEQAIMELERKYIETRNELTQLRKMCAISLTPIGPETSPTGPSRHAELNAEALGTQRSPAEVGGGTSAGAKQIVGADECTQPGVLEGQHGPHAGVDGRSIPLAAASAPIDPSPRLLEGFLRPLLASVGIEGEDAAMAITGAMATALKDTQSRGALLRALHMCAGSVASTEVSGEPFSSPSETAGQSSNQSHIEKERSVLTSSFQKSSTESLMTDTTQVPMGHLNVPRLVRLPGQDGSSTTTHDAASSGA
ncbi:hypothetical protein CCYA_CCYA04G1373 [Cyanidiococcus yangmingshanensis]|nr:hypothetical protein CCYA_CCYA04G1373 [Cyanidiococcus yangmingshanensis]